MLHDLAAVRDNDRRRGALAGLGLRREQDHGTVSRASVMRIAVSFLTPPGPPPLASSLHVVKTNRHRLVGNIAFNLALFHPIIGGDAREPNTCNVVGQTGVYSTGRAIRITCAAGWRPGTVPCFYGERGCAERWDVASGGAGSGQDARPVRRSGWAKGERR